MPIMEYCIVCDKIVIMNVLNEIKLNVEFYHHL